VAEGGEERGAASEAARRHFATVALLGPGLRVRRLRASAEGGLLEFQDGIGWAFIAWDARVLPLGLIECDAAGRGRILSAASEPWLAHALLLGLAQASLPQAEFAYLAAFDAPEAGCDRALVADCLDHELVVPLCPGAEVMHGLEFAAWLGRRGSDR
jgi:hypothetical protein